MSASEDAASIAEAAQVAEEDVITIVTYNLMGDTQRCIEAPDHPWRPEYGLPSTVDGVVFQTLEMALDAMENKCVPDVKPATPAEVDAAQTRLLHAIPSMRSMSPDDWRSYVMGPVGDVSAERKCLRWLWSTIRAHTDAIMCLQEVTEPMAAVLRLFAERICDLVGVEGVWIVTHCVVHDKEAPGRYPIGTCIMYCASYYMPLVTVNTSLYNAGLECAPDMMAELFAPGVDTQETLRRRIDSRGMQMVLLVHVLTNASVVVANVHGVQPKTQIDVTVNNLMRNVVQKFADTAEAVCSSDRVTAPLTIAVLAGDLNMVPKDLGVRAWQEGPNGWWDVRGHSVNSSVTTVVKQPKTNVPFAANLDYIMVRGARIPRGLEGTSAIELPNREHVAVGRVHGHITRAEADDWIAAGRFLPDHDDHFSDHLPLSCGFRLLAGRDRRKERFG